jgi:hypothetical protein
MDLKQTTDLMLSQDYKERFIAEYWQTKIRYEKLKHFNNIIEAACRTQGMERSIVEPLHDCPQHLLREQQEVMGQYLHILEVRAVIEEIDLSKGEIK